MTAPTPTPVRITGAQALRRLREVVAERPEWVAERLYVKDGAPECIVGHVLAREGVDPSDMDGAYYGVNTLLASLKIDSDWPSKLILKAAQRRQDDGAPWSSALDIAEQVAREHGVTDAAGQIVGEDSPGVAG